MIIKKYLVANMNEGLTRIRYELGKDAIIISQRKVRKPGIKGLFSKKVIEVTAAIENSQVMTTVVLISTAVSTTKWMKSFKIH